MGAMDDVSVAPIPTPRSTDQRAADNRLYYLRHRDAVRDRKRAWRAANPDLARERSRASKTKHRADILPRKREYMRGYYVRNADRIRAANLVWLATHPDQARELRARQRHLRRARLAGVEREPIDRMVVFERDGGICGICRHPVPKRKGVVSLDHIIPIVAGGPHTYANIQLAHLRCNSRRGHRGPAQLRLTI